ncbi:unnamed protein product, partial [Discosporangium mesarthrocarpum]
MSSTRGFVRSATLVRSILVGCVGGTFALAWTGHEFWEKKRRDVLVAALVRRLAVDHHPPLSHFGQLSSSAIDAGDSLLSSNYVVVMGPDAYLTSIATQRTIVELALRAQSSPVRFVLPAGFRLGDGILSAEMEKQLLNGVGGGVREIFAREKPTTSSQSWWEIDKEPLTSSPSPQTSQLNSVDDSVPLDCLYNNTPSAAVDHREDRLSLTLFEAGVLSVSSALLDSTQLDRVAQLALETALRAAAAPNPFMEEVSPVVMGRENRTRMPRTSDDVNWPEGSNAAARDESEGNGEATLVESEASRHSGAGQWGRGLIVALDMAQSQALHQAEGMGYNGLEGWRDVIQWSWSLASHGLADVVVSSTDPFMCQQLLSVVETSTGDYTCNGRSPCSYQGAETPDEEDASPAASSNNVLGERTSGASLLEGKEVPEAASGAVVDKEKE